jgi:hypothetical protein
VRLYPTAVTETRAPPITSDRVERFLANRDGEVRPIARRIANPVGIGAIVVITCEAE